MKLVKFTRQRDNPLLVLLVVEFRVWNRIHPQYLILDILVMGRDQDQICSPIPKYTCLEDLRIGMVGEKNKTITDQLFEEKVMPKGFRVQITQRHNQVAIIETYDTQETP